MLVRSAAENFRVLKRLPLLAKRKTAAARGVALGGGQAEGHQRSASVNPASRMIPRCVPGFKS